MGRDARGAPGGSAPRAGARFYRAHGLGNDYLVFEGVAPTAGGWVVDPAGVARVCDRHLGVGSDGIVLLLDTAPPDGVFPLRMFNPDGSEFERSGNGLRVLASYLHRRGLVGDAPFDVASGGSRIPMTVHGVDARGEYDISVEMGRAHAGPEAVGLDPEGPALGNSLSHPELGAIAFEPISVGNPHAVVFEDEGAGPPIDAIGPFLGTHAAFAEGTNVQLVRVAGPGTLDIQIWERGVGRTTASGTSSCASAAAAVHTGRIEPGEITVRMAGGRLRVSVSRELEIVLRGPVREVSEGSLTDAFVRSLED